MSQIGSSSGVRVAAQPLSNVYTVLLLVGAAALFLTLIMLCVVMDGRYGTILGFTQEGEANKELPEAIAGQQKSRRAELEDVDQALKRFPEGISASAGTAPSGTGAEAAPGTGGTATPPETGGETAPGAGTEAPADAPAGN